MRQCVQGIAAAAAAAVLLSATSTRAGQINGWRPTVITIPTVSGHVGNNIAVTVRVTGVDGIPAGVGRPVNFYVQLPTRSVSIGSNWINGQGYASINFTPRNYGIGPGNYAFAAVYLGDGTSAQSLPASKCTLAR